MKLQWFRYMCGICGELRFHTHWTERIPWVKDEEVESGGEVARVARRLRVRRALIVGGILAPYGLTVRYWEGGKYIISDMKGQSVIVNDLAGLWPWIEKLLGKPVDPLDERLLEYLQGSGVDG
jgi:hypothetical protein